MQRRRNGYLRRCSCHYKIHSVLTLLTPCRVTLYRIYRLITIYIMYTKDPDASVLRPTSDKRLTTITHSSRSTQSVLVRYWLIHECPIRLSYTYRPISCDPILRFYSFILQPLRGIDPVVDEHLSVYHAGFWWGTDQQHGSNVGISHICWDTEVDGPKAGHMQSCSRWHQGSIFDFRTTAPFELMYYDNVTHTADVTVTITVSHITCHYVRQLFTNRFVDLVLI